MCVNGPRIIAAFENFVNRFSIRLQHDIIAYLSVFVTSPPFTRTQSERERVRLPEEMFQPLLSPFPRLGLSQQEVPGRLQRDQMFLVQVQERFHFVDEFPPFADRVEFEYQVVVLWHSDQDQWTFLFAAVYLYNMHTI